MTDPPTMDEIEDGFDVAPYLARTPWSYPFPRIVEMTDMWAGARPDTASILLARLNLWWQRGIICDRPILQGGAQWVL